MRSEKRGQWGSGRALIGGLHGDFTPTEVGSPWRIVSREMT